ncbi:butyrate kinase [Actinomycetota bacterium]
MDKILAINPGNTSTKIGLFEDNKLINQKSIRHDKKDLDIFPKILDQLKLRSKAIGSFLRDNNIRTSDIDHFIGRGGLLKPLMSGLYMVNQEMISDLRSEKYGEHSSNLGALIAQRIANKYGKKAYILDPVCVDELEPIARITGHPEIHKVSAFHALNQKSVARRASAEMGKRYGDINLIVAHLGSGISVGLHRKGKIVDVNNAIAGEGPFSPERSGGIPAGTYLKYAYDNKLDFQDSLKMLYGQGGMYAYLGTNDFQEVMEDYDKGNNEKLKLVVDAMAYKISKAISALAAPVSGEVDGIVITGGLAYSKTFTSIIESSIKFLTSNIFIYPGEDELQAMADGVLLGLKGEIEIHEYTSDKDI